MAEFVRWFHELSLADVPSVGGKNASLGELTRNLEAAGVRVPGGFATTASAFEAFMAHEDLRERIEARLASLEPDDVVALAEAGKEIRAWLREAPLPPQLEREVTDAYAQLGDAGKPVAVAVRSSATAEDLPEASFAGQQETFLNVRGTEEVLATLREVYASLYTDRAIAYRRHHGFAHAEVAMSVGVQRMVRSDLAASGVAFTLDTESGFRDVVFITSSYGLGELLVQGAVNPDEFYLYKPNLAAGRPAVLSRTLGSKRQRMVYAEGGKRVRVEEVPPELQGRFSLRDDELATLGMQALAIEEHYGRPVDIEWAKDGEDGEIYIVQARPETVKSREEGAPVLERFALRERGRVIVEGRSVGQRIGSGRARVVLDVGEIAQVQQGDVLVTDMTDPDWEPVMKRASAIVTNRGGRTCHAAIIARELGIPAVVGAQGATERIADGQEVTVSCAEGDAGYVYDGRLEVEVQRIELGKMPEIPVRLMMNVASPERAFAFSRLPHRGVGLARLEFIVSNTVGVHPQALLDYPEVEGELKREIERRSRAYDDPARFYLDKLAEGVATIAAAFAPEPVIVRLTDFKSNEYRHLLGGERYEPVEENPMIGFRGASRYRAEAFRPAFALECRAIKKVRDELGLDNVQVMIPFVRTVGEAEEVIEILRREGLERGRNGLKLIMMCEVPSNALLAEQFLRLFDGFSIGSNDLTQFTLALDRDSGLVASLFNEQDPAVKLLMERAIGACKGAGKYVGICGQGPSDHPALARWLVEQGIDSISLNPDTVLSTWLYLAGERG